MIIIRLQGGLGNQMFQYAFYLNVRRILPNADVRMDLSAYRETAFHYGFELDKIFGLRPLEAPDCKVACLTGRIPIPKVFAKRRLTRGSCKLLRRIYYMFNRNSDRPFEFFERNFKDIHSIIQKINQCNLAGKDIYLDGWWNQEEKWKYDSDNVRRLYHFNDEDHNELKEWIDRINMTESCSIHIRLGDYVNNANFDILHPHYYQRAINYINNHVNQPTFFVFSDDISGAKNILQELELGGAVYVDVNQGIHSYRDMLLMSKCHHNIIANSTFSYWGAWLNDNPNKIVIQPNKTLADVPYPLKQTEWVTIDCDE